MKQSSGNLSAETPSPSNVHLPCASPIEPPTARCRSCPRTSGLTGLGTTRRGPSVSVCIWAFPDSRLFASNETSSSLTKCHCSRSPPKLPPIGDHRRFLPFLKGRVSRPRISARRSDIMPHGAMFDQQAITSRPPGIFNFSIYGCSKSRACRAQDIFSKKNSTSQLPRRPPRSRMYT